MKSSFLAAIVLCCMVGCVDPPIPTGPAAEASTDPIEITMDAPITDGSATNVQE